MRGGGRGWRIGGVWGRVSEMKEKEQRRTSL